MAASYRPVGSLLAVKYRNEIRRETLLGAASVLPRRRQGLEIGLHQCL
jgi:hypothetical protein